MQTTPRGGGDSQTQVTAVDQEAQDAEEAEAPDAALEEAEAPDAALEDATVVAKIGDVEYETLAAAFLAAKDGETITLVADEINLGYSKESSIDAGTTGKKASLAVPASTSVTLNMNGKTLEANGDFDHYMFYVPAGSSLTVTGDGTLDYSLDSYDGYLFRYDGTVTIDEDASDLTIKTGWNYGNGNGTIRFQSGKYNKSVDTTYYDGNNYECAYEDGYYVIKALPVICTVDSVGYKKISAAVTAAQSAGKPIVLTENVTSDTAISAAVTIDGATNGKTFTTAKAISNGTFTGTVASSNTISGGTFNAAVTSSGTISGGTFAGDVTSTGTISGGTFAKAIDGKNFSGGTYDVAVTASGTISGGTFNAGVTGAVISGGTFNSTVSATSVSGGVFANNPDNLKEGYACATNGESNRFLVAAAANVESGKVVTGSYSKYYGVNGFIDDATCTTLTTDSSNDYVVKTADLDDQGKLHKGAYAMSIPSAFLTSGYTAVKVANVDKYYIGKGITVHKGGISGGIFDFDPTEAVDTETFDVTHDAQAGTWTVSLKAGKGCAFIGDKEYLTLADAINAAPDNTETVITMHADTTEGVTISSAKKIVLDLNGQTISYNGYVFQNSGTLIIKDTSEGKTGAITAGNSALVCKNGSTTTLLSGTISGKGSYQSTGTITAEYGSKVYVKGGSVICDGGYYALYSNAYSADSVVISGGELTYNGTINSIIYSSQYCSSVTITGGIVRGSISGASSYWSKTKVSGGTFTVNPSTSSYINLDTGYGVIDNGDGTYTVKEIVYTISTDTCEHGSVLVNGEAEVDVKAGSTVTLTCTPDADYKLSTYLVNDKAIDGNTFTASEDCTVTATFVAKEYIAQNTTSKAKFETITEAAQAAKSGETIKLLRNCSFSEHQGLTNEAWNWGSAFENITLDLANHTLYLTGEAQLQVAGKNITVKRGEICSEHNYAINTTVYNPTFETWEYSTITFVNLTINAGVNMAKTNATFSDCRIDATGKQYYAIYQEQASTATILSGRYAGLSCALWPAAGTSMSVSGGVFGNDITKESVPGTITLAEGYASMANTDEATKDKYPYKVSLKICKNITTGAEYDSIGDALNAASDGDTIQLSNDITLHGLLDVDLTGKAVTLDLNGKTWTLNDSEEAQQHAIRLSGGGTLIIDDSTEGKAGKMQYTATSGSCTMIAVNSSNTANVIVKAGTVDGKIETGGDLAIQGGKVASADCEGSFVMTDGELGDLSMFSASGTAAIISGGKITGQFTLPFSGDGITVDVSGSAFIHNITNQSDQAGACDNVVTVKGGTIEWLQPGGKGVCTISGGYVKNVNGGVFAILGGQFDNLYYNVVADEEYWDDETATVLAYRDSSYTIGGGIFASTAYVIDKGARDIKEDLASDYVVMANTDPLTKEAYPWKSSKKITVPDKPGFAEKENVNVEIDAGQKGGTATAVEGATEAATAVADAINTQIGTSSSSMADLTTDTKLVEASIDADKIAEMRQDTKNGLDEVLQESGKATVDFEVRSYLDVKVEVVSVKPSTVNDIKTIKLDITPMYNVYYKKSTEAASAAKPVYVDAQGKAQDQKLVVTQPVTVTMKVPTGYTVTGDITILHVTDDGTSYTYDATYNAADDTITFVNPNGFCEMCVLTGVEQVVAKNTTLDKEYATLAAAFEDPDLASGQTVTLLKSYECDDVVTLAAGKNVTLSFADGATFTCTNTTSAALTVSKGATLTLAGNGGIVSKTTGTVISNKGTLNINGGTFTNTSLGYVVQNNDSSAITTVAGGQFKTAASSKQEVYASSVGAVSITGGIYAHEVTTGIASGYECIANPDTTTVTTYPYAVAAKAYVAQIVAGGETTQYETLQEAINAVQDGQTITMLADIELDASIDGKDKSYTIDGAGYKVTQKTGLESGPYQFFNFGSQTTGAGKTYTVKNWTIDGLTLSTYLFRVEGCTLTLDNVTFQNCAATYITLFTHANGTLKDCVYLNNTAGDRIVDFNSNASEDGYNDIFVVDDCLFKGNTSNGTATVGISEDKTATVTNSTFESNVVNGSNNGAPLYLGDRCSTCTGCLFKNNVVNYTTTSGYDNRVRAAGAIFTWSYGTPKGEISNNAFVGNSVVKQNASYLTCYAKSVYAGGRYATDDLSCNYWDDGQAAKIAQNDTTSENNDVYAEYDTYAVTASHYGESYALNPDTTYGVTVAAHYDYVAQVASTGAKYESLQEAIAAAAANDTVTLLESVTIADPLTVDKALTIQGQKSGDVNPKITFNGAGSDNKHNGLILMANVTLKNVDVLNASSASYARTVSVGSDNIEVNIDSCNIKSNNHTALRTYDGISGVTVTVSNSKLEGYCALQLWADNSAVTVNNSNIASVNPNDDPNNSYGGIVFECDFYGNQVEGATVNLNNCAVTVSPEGTSEHWVVLFKGDSADNKVVIDGGTFTCGDDEFACDDGSANYIIYKPTTVVADNQISEEFTKSTVTYQEAEYTKLSTNQPYFFQVGKSYYKTFAKAVAATTAENNVVKLTHDSLGVASVIEIASGDVVLDLNGHALAYADISATSPAKITITDSSDYDGCVYFEDNLAGNVVIEKGVFSEDVTDFVAETSIITALTGEMDGWYVVEPAVASITKGEPASTVYYTTLAEALKAAESGDTIEILDGTWGADAIGELTTAEAGVVRYKSLTIQPATDAKVTFTSSVSLGYDDSSTANATMTVKNIAFQNASLSISNYVNVNVEGCTFTGGSSTAGDLIILDSCCKNHKTTETYPDSQVTVKNCTIDGSAATSAPGIRLRNSGNVTLTGNTIKNTAGNGILFEANTALDDDAVKAISVTGNSITEWNASNAADGGRAIRMSLQGSDSTGTTDPLAEGSTVTVTGNVFTKATTGLDKPDFVKITGINGIVPNLDGNNWNYKPLSDVNGNKDIYTVDGAATTINNVVGPVCKIGETLYGSLADAVAAVTTSEQTKIEMIANDSFVGNSGITISATQNIVLELHGYTVTGVATQAATSQAILNYGTLTVSDDSNPSTGKITDTGLSTEEAGDWWSDPQRNYANNVITNKGTLTVKSGTIEKGILGDICYAVDLQSGCFYLNGGVISGGPNAGDAGCAMRLQAQNDVKTIVEINGGVVSDGYCGFWIHLPSGSGTPDFSMKITAGEITGGTYAFYDYSYGQSYENVNYEITGGTFNGMVYSYGANANFKGGVYNGSVTLRGSTDISNGTFNGKTYSSASTSITGGTFNGQVISYLGYYTGKAESFAISGGTFNDEVDIYDYYGNGQTTSVTRGKFAGDYGICPIYSYNSKWYYTSCITGGVFANETYDYKGEITDSDWLYCIADGYCEVDNTDEATKEAYPYTVGLAQASVARDGYSTEYYATLSEALAKAAEYASSCTNIEVSLLQNVTLADTDDPIAVPAAFDGVIDLNGHNIERLTSSNYAITIPSGANVTLVDSATDKGHIKGTPIASGNTKNPASLIQVKGTLTLGKAATSTEAAVDGAALISDYCCVKVDEDPGAGVFTMNSGSMEIIANDKGYSGAIFALMDWATATINGGTVNGNVQVLEYKGNAVSKAGTLTVNGGTFTPAKIYFYAYDNDYAPTATVAASLVNTLTPEIQYAPEGTAISTTTDASGNKTYKAVAAVAKITREGVTSYFATLDDAAVAAKTGDTIELVADIDNTATYAKDAGHVINFVDGVTLDLASHTITSNNYSVVYQGNSLTIKNGNFVAANSGSYALFIGDETVTTGVVLDDLNCTGGINLYKTTATIKDCTSASAQNYYAVWADEQAAVTIEGGSYKHYGDKPVVDADDEGSLTITGGIYSKAPADAYVAAGKCVVDNTDASTKATYPYTISDAGVVLKHIDELSYYTTLNGALAKAVDGDLVTLLSANAEGATIPVGVTVYAPSTAAYTGTFAAPAAPSGAEYKYVVKKTTVESGETSGTYYTAVKELQIPSISGGTADLNLDVDVEQSSGIVVEPSQSAPDGTKAMADAIAAQQTVSSQSMADLQPETREIEKSITPAWVEAARAVNANLDTLLKNAQPAQGETNTVNFAVKTYYKVTVLSTETSTSTSNAYTKIYLDITPYYTITATDESKPTADPVVVVPETKLEVTQSKIVTIDVPEGYTVVNPDDLNILHVKDDGTSYNYNGDSVSYDEATNTISFVNPNGFSDFFLTNGVAPAAATVATVSHDGADTEFTTIAAALAFANGEGHNGDVITLNANVTAPTSYTFSKDATLNLNGYSYTVPADVDSTPALTIASGADVIITNGVSSTGGLIVTGTVDVEGTLGMAGLGFGTGGLVPAQTGHLAIGEHGAVDMMSVWTGTTPNQWNANSANFFGTIDDGAMITCCNEAWIYGDAATGVSLWMKVGDPVVAQTTKTLTTGTYTYWESFGDGTLQSALTGAPASTTVYLVDDYDISTAVTVPTGKTFDFWTNIGTGASNLLSLSVGGSLTQSTQLSAEQMGKISAAVGYYVIETANAGGTWTYSLAQYVASVTDSSSNVTYYKTLKEAQDAVETNGIVTLLKDIDNIAGGAATESDTEGSLIVKPHTYLDLNGHYVRTSYTAVFGQIYDSQPGVGFLATEGLMAPNNGELGKATLPVKATRTLGSDTSASAGYEFYGLRGFAVYYKAETGNAKNSRLWIKAAVMDGRSVEDLEKIFGADGKGDYTIQVNIGVNDGRVVPLTISSTVVGQWVNAFKESTTSGIYVKIINGTATVMDGYATQGGVQVTRASISSDAFTSLDSTYMGVR